MSDDTHVSQFICLLERQIPSESPVILTIGASFLGGTGHDRPLSASVAFNERQTEESGHDHHRLYHGPVLPNRRPDAALPKHPQARLWPREVVTLGVLHALKGVGNRAFYRWLTRDYSPLFPYLPERSR